jgi:putative PIN family toxin of toxin-antitoxin system
VRAVLDVNVLIAGVLSRDGAPAALISRWLAGEFELVVSPLLLDELERTLARPKIRKYVPAEDAADFVELVRTLGDHASDPAEPPSVRSRDGGDDYLVALAETQRAILVTGDKDLLDLAGDLPIESPPASSLAFLPPNPGARRYLCDHPQVSEALSIGHLDSYDLSRGRPRALGRPARQPGVTARRIYSVGSSGVTCLVSGS